MNEKGSRERQRNNVDTIVTKGVIFGKALSSSLVSVCARVLMFERDKRDCEVEEEEALRMYYCKNNETRGKEPLA
jgi:hypothetical protein